MTQKSSHEFSVGRLEKMFVRSVLQFDSRALAGSVDLSNELGKYFNSGVSQEISHSPEEDFRMHNLRRFGGVNPLVDWR